MERLVLRHNRLTEYCDGYDYANDDDHDDDNDDDNDEDNVNL